MPTRLFIKDEYVTPEEYLKILEWHFKNLPVDYLFMPMTAFIGCDKDKNEMMIANTGKKTLEENIYLNKDCLPYHENFTIKTIKRDKAKAN